MPDTPIFPLDFEQFPLDNSKVQSLKPKIIIDEQKHKFKLLINIPGYKNDDVKVFAGNEKILVKAMDRMQLNCMNICKMYEAEYSLPAGISIEKLRKRHHDGVITLRGDFKQITDDTETNE